MKTLSKKYFWLSVEGTDAVGKTWLVKEVEKFLKKRRVNFFIIKEFSDSCLGDLIREVITQKRFFSLRKEEEHPFAETLLLSADFLYQLEEKVLQMDKKKKIFVVSDRGPYSSFAYQLLRIKKKYNEFDKKELQKWIKNIFYPTGLPDFTILLTSLMSVIKKRSIKRDGPITKKELAFISQVQEEYLNIFKAKKSSSHLILESRDNGLAMVKEKTIQIIEQILSKEFYL